MSTLTVSTFGSSEHLVGELIQNRAQGPTTLYSTILVPTLKKGRYTKIPYPFRDSIMATKREYVFVNSTYQRLVNNRRIKDQIQRHPAFTPQSLPWGQWYESRVIIEKGARYYLRYYIELAANYHASKRIYHYPDGTTLTREELQLLPDYLPKRDLRSVVVRQALPEHRLIKPRNVKLDGITAIKTRGILYVRRGSSISEAFNSPRRTHKLKTCSYPNKETLECI